MARSNKPGKAQTPPRAVIVHGRDHACAAAAAAAELGVAVRLRSAPGAAAYAGTLWFLGIVDGARAAFPDARIEAALDCGDQPGTALAALRQGAKMIRLEGPKAVRDKVAAIAGQYGAHIDTDRRKALDLFGVDDPEAACRAWLTPGKAPAGT